MKLRIAIATVTTLFMVCAALAAIETNPTAGPTVSAERKVSPAMINSAGNFAPVPVPEPSEKAVQFYHSGVRWWLFGQAWLWFVPALVLFTGFSGWLGRQAIRIGRWEIPATFVFVLLYLIVAFVLTLPVNYFREFVRLHDFGLSNQTFARWLDHSVKSLLVDLMVFGISFMVLRQLIRRSPQRWWIYCSAFATAVVFVMFFIYPIWIDPLFNRFGAMKDKKLEAEIVALADRAGIEGARIFEVDMSADTKVLNAYVKGLGSTKRIVLWDTIIAKLSPDELRSVMAHEMGHYVLGHVLVSCLLVAAIYSGALWLTHRLGSRLISKFRNRFGFESLSDLGAIPLLFLFVAMFQFLADPVFNLVSRHQEHEADRFALEITRNNRATALAFVKLQQENLSVPRPGFLVHLWRGTHPSLGDRIDFANSYRPWTEGKAGKYERRFKDN